MPREVVVVSSCRTPIGSFQGSLSSLSAPKLGAAVIKEVVKRGKIDAAKIDEVIMGEVISAGVGQAPARQASLGAGLPSHVPCTTVNKVCGSGMKAVMMACQSILLEEADCVVAGGMESMSNAPYLLPTARAGMRMGNQVAVDSMINDGLWDPYGNLHMGTFGDLCAAKYGISRREQDDFAKESYQRALNAQQSGFFDNEIVKITIANAKGDIVVEKDEEPLRFMPEKMDKLKPAFGTEGSVTAANASKINDGAAALLLMSGEKAKEPQWFTTAPIAAINKVLAKAKLTLGEIDLFEINEAFSVVPLVAMKELGIPRDKVNVHGGAVALGHPIGSSGARILVTLISALKIQDKELGCAVICLGGGGAVAVIVSR